TFKPLITPRRAWSSGACFNWAVTSLPFRVTVMLFNAALAGALTSISASPPVTRSGRDDKVLIWRRAAGCDQASVAQHAIRQTVAKIVARLRRHKFGIIAA